MESTNRPVSVVIDLTDDTLNANQPGSEPLADSDHGDQRTGSKQWIGAEDLVKELHATVAPRRSPVDGTARENRTPAATEHPEKLGPLHPVRWWRAIKRWLAACDQAVVNGGGRAY